MSFPFPARHAVFVSLRERLLLAAGVPASLLPACIEEQIPPHDASAQGDAAVTPTRDASAPSCPATAIQRQCFTRAQMEQQATYGVSMIAPPTRIRSDEEVQALFLDNGCLPPQYVFEGCCNHATSAGEPSSEGCCYTFCVQSCCGRPFLIHGQARQAGVVSRKDWLAALAQGAEDIERLPAWLRARLADEWLDDARMEHASVAAFARFSLELLAHGAPAELLLAAQRAGADEVEHARLCFALASRYAGRALGPDKLRMADVSPAATLRESVLCAVAEGCVGETLAALRAQAALDEARCPAVREVLARIVEDETRHAELAFRYLAWTLEQDPLLADAVAALLHDEERRQPALEPDGLEPEAAACLRAHGRVAPAHDRALRRVAFAQVIAPCFRAILAGAAHGRGAATTQAALA
jgi:hypothetical protein